MRSSSRSPRWRMWLSIQGFGSPNGLRWNDVGLDSIAVEERFCRGDWSEPKSDASNATIAVDRCVVERIHRLKLLTVETSGKNEVGEPGGSAFSISTDRRHYCATTTSSQD